MIQNQFTPIFEQYPDLLTAKQVQTALGIGRAGTYRLLDAGIIQNFKIGNAYKIPKTALQQYIQKSCEGSEIK